MNVIDIVCLMLIIGHSFEQELSEWSVNINPALIEDCLRKSIHHVNFQPLDEINLADASNIVCETKIDNGLHIRITFDYQDRAWQCFLYKSVIQILTTRFEKCKVLENEELVARAQQQQQRQEKENEARIDQLNKPIPTNPIETLSTNISNGTEGNSSAIVQSISTNISNGTEGNSSAIVQPISTNISNGTEGNSSAIVQLIPTNLNGTSSTNISNGTEGNSSPIANQTLNNTVILADGDTDDELLIDDRTSTTQSYETSEFVDDNFDDGTIDPRDEDSAVQEYLRLKSNLANHLGYSLNGTVLREEDIEP